MAKRKNKNDKQSKMAKQIVEDFKKMFEAMSPEERDAYLKKYGFDFGTPEQNDKDDEVEEASAL